ncbi:MAG: hypothetical protein U0169_17675 [Polyangiaceae bacterium]
MFQSLSLSSTVRSVSVSLSTLALAFATGCSGESAQSLQEGGDSDMDIGQSEGALSGATYEGGAVAMTAYFAEATKNATAQCTQAYSAVGSTFVALSDVSGIAAAGALGVGTCSINGKPAYGLVGAAAVGAGSLASISITGGGAVFGQLSVPFQGASVPADAAAADRIFDQAFGAAARGTLSLSEPVKVAGKIVGYRAKGTTQVTDNKGVATTVTIAVGVVKIGTQVTAVQTTATGKYARWAI